MQGQKICWKTFFKYKKTTFPGVWVSGGFRHLDLRDLLVYPGRLKLKGFRSMRQTGPYRPKPVTWLTGSVVMIE